MRAGYARRGEVAVVELAGVCGLARLPGGRPAPLTASSFGAGEVLRAALEAGARRIVLGVGGSASTDGGAGLLQALGARVLDTSGEPVRPAGAGWRALRDVAALDLTGLHPALYPAARTAEIILAADVDNPLTGPDGAAEVYGPQKGASPAEVAALAAGLRRWAAVVAAAVGRDWSQAPGAGAAGGVGFAALAVLGATRRPGIELVLDLAGFETALDGADLVITGEGSLDAQSLAGKTPVGVARAAARRGIAVVAVAGRSTLREAELAAAGIAAVYPLSDLEPDLERCRAEAARLLRRTGQMIARDRLAEGEKAGPGHERTRRRGRTVTGMNSEDKQAWPDLAGRALGGSVIYANDELFAERENLIKPEEPVFRPHTFGHKGQIMDGWETRRRREPGSDAAIVRLGCGGVVRRVVVDTSYFTGNYPPEVSVEACGAEGYPSPADLAEAAWTTLVPRSPVAGDARNEFEVEPGQRATHVRLTMFPDGGVARLRVYGEPVPDPRLLPATIDLAALENGAVVTGCSNMFYSSPANLLLPGQARVMGDGWETSRRRDQANDWVEVRLACAGSVEVVELDTSHFVGNAPGWATLSGDGPGDGTALLPRTALQPDTRHRFAVPGGPVTGQVRLDIYPDGGMARLRVLGRPTAAAREALAERFLRLLPEPQLAGLLRAAGLPPAEAARRAEAPAGLDAWTACRRRPGSCSGSQLSTLRQSISVIEIHRGS